MSAPANLLTEWARVLVGCLARAGVRDVVASPGSRSTPFLCAALDSSELAVVTLPDERSAGFFALGRARVTGVPALLLSTSGSAAANYWPAVVEASESFTPLLVLSADRPLCLHGGGAHQTIDQSRLYGAFAREFCELGEPDDDPGALEALARRTTQAVLRARFPTPGPVQLNARAKKPLEPRAATTDAERALRTRADRAIAGASRVSVPRAAPDPEALDALHRACRESERPLVVCGPRSALEPPVRAGALARALGAPLVAEATSQIRFALDAVDDVVVCDAAERVLPRAKAPDLILQLGATPVSSAWQRFSDAHPGVRRFVVAAHGWPDPDARAERVVMARPGEVVEALLERLGARAPGNAWLASFASANAAAWREIDGALSDGASSGCIARAVVDALPSGAVLVLGNSLPVRDVDRFCPAGPRGLTVISQRGAAGIDGVLSAAAGSAAAAGRPTALLIGDVSLLHDIGGLWAARLLRSPFAIVVVNNGGGRIFDELPIAGTLDAEKLAHWLTPHDLDFAHAAALYELPFVRAERPGELATALAGALAHPGATLIEAR